MKLLLKIILQRLPGQADLPKRAKEVGFKAIDLKAGFGLQMSMTGGTPQDGPAGDLQTWSHGAKPRTFFLMAVRVIDESDLRSCVAAAGNIARLLDGVGLFAYTNDDLAKPPATYHAAKYNNQSIPTDLLLGPVVYRVASILKSLP